MSLRIHGGKHTDRQVLGKSNRAGGDDDDVRRNSSSWSAELRLQLPLQVPLRRIKTRDYTFTCPGLQSTIGEDERNTSDV